MNAILLRAIVVSLLLQAYNGWRLLPDMPFGFTAAAPTALWVRDGAGRAH